MMGALMAWAWQQPCVPQIAAEARGGGIASRRVLTKLGFVRAGTANEPGHVRFERTE